MERHDFVELINDNKDLKTKNIFKGYKGTLISHFKDVDQWIVLFMDPYNYGEYAVAGVNSKDLQVVLKYESNFIKEIEEDTDFYTHTELKVPKFKEYDRVILIKDKPEYVNEGVKKGMMGCIMSSYAIKSKWQVIFSDEITGEDIADLTVHEDDMELANL